MRNNATGVIRVIRLVKTALLALLLVAGPVMAEGPGGVIHKMLFDMPPKDTSDNGTDRRSRYAKALAQLFVGITSCFIKTADFAHLVGIQLRVPMLLAFGVFVKLCAVSYRRSIFEVAQAIISWIAVFMVSLFVAWANEGQQNKPMDETLCSATIFVKANALMPERVYFPWAKHTPFQHIAAIVGAGKAFDASEVANLIHAFITGDWQPSFVRGKIGAHGDSFRCVMPRAVCAAPGPSIGLRPLYHIGMGIATC